MKSYSRAPDECTDRVKHLLRCFYPELEEAGLRVDILSVSNDGDGPALTHQGYAAMALIRVLDSKARAKNSGDVEIIIDEARYIKLSDAEKDALLDHELYHVELRKNKKNGRVKLDEHGRPKVGMRKHDYQFGWFVAIADRHGTASMEVKQANKMFLAERQTFFAFVQELAALPAPANIMEKVVDSVAASDGGPFKKLAQDGVSVTISSGDRSVTVDKGGVTTSGKRKISKADLAAAKT